ncbi:T9SS type A sorting domain-containing protein [Flavobacterium rakeshii]|uniref:T9SS type A sorting domain-containing protein n=1 Tax=Flavobacterium rakeshii TaxID=1038845 RepID=A0A6N8H8P2_9FLAO|nr:T9SS type A sorting domain-containing protein [Flavobacterium rakeshii]MUV02200.1 T9SS type A sorting domain-containing protein [Flavobacterium rakeshii]
MKRITLPANFRPYHGNVVVNRYSRFLLFFVMLLMGYTAKSQIYHHTDWEDNLSGWQSSGTSGSFSTTTASSCSGAKAARANIYNENYTYFRSPELLQSDGSEATFTYSFKLTKYFPSTDPALGGEFTIDVQWTNNLDGTWTTLETIDNSNYVSTTDCAERTVTFTPASGDTVYVRFVGTAIGDADLYFYFDNVTITQTTCIPPSGLVLDDLVAGEVSWTAPDSAPSGGYDYYLSITDVTPDSATVPTGASTETSATLTTTPGVHNYFWVRSNCEGELSPWIGPLTFYAPQVPATLPFEEDFEDVSGMAIFNGDETNKWYIGSVVNNGGSNSLYISSDDNVTNGYVNSQTTRVHSFRDISVPAGVTELKVSFDWKAGGEDGYDYLKVWAVPVTFVPTPGSAILTSNGIAVSGNLSGNGEAFQLAEYFVNVEDYAGQSLRLIFEWRNDGSGGVNPSAAVDNISIEEVTCFPPSELEDVVTTENVTLSWTAADPVPASGYDYYYSTENTAPNTATTPTGNSTETSILLDELDGNTIYYYWVRSNCGGSFSEWVSGGSFRTECETATLPYMFDFTDYTGSTGSTCWKEKTGELGTAVTLTGTSSSWTSNNYNNSTNSNGTAAYINLYDTDDEWIISPALDLGDGSVTYQLEFDASVIPWSGSDAVTDMEDKYAKVVVSTDGGLTWDEANVLTTFDNDNIPAGGVHQIISLEGYTGVVRIGFYGHSDDDAPDLRFYIDNFKVDVQPDCALPESLVFTGATENSVSVSWSAPENAPENGYEYFIADTDTAPASDFDLVDNTEQTEATIGGLNAGETYYFWVRSVCAVSVFSEWVGPFEVATLCDSPDIESVNATPICGVGTSTITADVSGGTVKWYTQEVGGPVIATGATFETPELTETTTYYVTAVNEGIAQGGGARVSTASTDSTTPSNYGLVFDVYNDFTLNSVDVYITDDTADDLTIKLFNSQSEELQTITVELPAGDSTTPVQHTIELGWIIPTGTGYRIMAVNGPNMVRELGIGGFPYAIGDAGAVTNGYVSGSSPNYYYFYNWNFTAGCAAPRVAVEVTVTDAPEVVLTASNDAICEGENTTLTVTSDNEGYTYVWMPGNLEGSEQVVTPTETTTYTVTATDAVSGCVTSQTITINVNPLPQNFDLGADMEVCINNGPVAITAQGGNVLGVILEEGFNESTNNWTTINNSTGGTVANAAWTLREDGYTVPSYSAVSSDDNSQFYLSNSDSQGLGGSTSTILQSPAFSTEGYVDVSVAFSHFFREPSAGSSEGTVEVSLNGTDWTILETYDSNTGNYTEFASESVVLTEAFLDQETVYVRFKFEGNWRYFWAIDNVNISGSQEGVVVWEPAEGLYLDEDATIAYTQGTDAQVVYTLPANTVEYTATVTSPFGCTATATVELTPIETPVPVVDAEQEFCNGATVIDLVADGNDIQWYANQTEGEALTEETVLETATYYVSQLVNGCESERVAVDVTINVTAVPVVDAEQEFCNSATVADLIADGNDIQWYANETEGEVLAEETALETATYYVSQLVNGCESERVAVAVTINVTPAPQGDEVQVIQIDDQDVATIEDIEVTGVEGGEITWYASEEDALAGENPLTEGTEVESETTYYAVQTVNGCSSDPFAVTVTITLDSKEFDLAQFTYWPNPVRDVLTVSYSSQITTVKVYNMVGQEVLSQKVNALEGTINMSALQDGTYLVNVATDTATKTIRVIKKQ